MPARKQLELGAAAAGSVYAVDQLLKGIQAERSHESKGADEHYLKALASAAVAIGACEMLRREANKEETRDRDRDVDSDDGDDGDVGLRDLEEGRASPERRSGEERRMGERRRSDHEHRHEEGHKRRLAEELVGAYAVGREMMGDKKHRIADLVAEVLGAAGLTKELSTHADKRDSHDGRD